MIPLMMQKDYSPKGWREFQPKALRLLACLVMLLTCNNYTRIADFVDEVIVNH